MRFLILVFACVILLSAPTLWAQTQSPTQPGETQFTGAIISEQNVTFAVVIVKNAVLNDKNLADDLIQVLEPSFGGIPVVLMIQDAEGTPSYYGRPDIAEFLSKTPLESIPWKTYALKQVQENRPVESYSDNEVKW